MIKCDVDKCLSNQNGVCQNDDINIMMNNGNIYSLECLDMESKDDKIVYDRIRKAMVLK